MLNKIQTALPEIKALTCAKINEALPDLQVITEFSMTQASLVMDDVTEEFSSHNPGASGLYIMAVMLFIEATPNVIQAPFNLKESGDFAFLPSPVLAVLDMSDLEVLKQDIAHNVSNKLVGEYRDYQQVAHHVADENKQP
jgi:hypothetical protein